ncbi:hypothetical protein [Pseudogemmobacter bohemicus]|uniref:hypothetical protein n=1 Tax=Pseudogemmobacter bohemicus TaxID=2250708 RepID=UPI000DD3A571|nr:hypothetical protein [Pseudogemmobacter bohemicus]
MVMCGPVSASCLPPERPWLPSEAADIRAYADLIRGDFESYIAAVQDYFRCLDAERARAFLEAQEVSQDYGRFQSIVGN